MKRKGKIVLAFVFFYFYFALVVSFWEYVRPIFFAYVCLMLIFFASVFKFLHNFVHTSVTDILKVINYFDKTITDLLLNNYIPYFPGQLFFFSHSKTNSCGVAIGYYGKKVFQTSEQI